MDVKTYQNLSKASPKTKTLINLEAKSISTKPKISNRVKNIAMTSAFVTLKDHKNNFRYNPTCRLISPSKSELGKLSKQPAEKINSDIIDNLQFNLWCNTDTVLKWFNNTRDKSNCSFTQFDIKEFYPWMTDNILHQTLKFAKQHRNID